MKEGMPMRRTSAISASSRVWRDRRIQLEPVHGSMDVNICTLHDDGEIRFKTGAAELSGITSRVADNPGLEQLIVTRIVCMTVNPECRLISLDNVLQPARECRVQGIVRSAAQWISTQADDA